MSKRPSRATVAGRVYLDLQAKARADGRQTHEFLQLYALEGFLGRLAASKYRSQLVLKGGALLAAYDARRATRDLDFQARRISNDQAVVLSMVKDIATVDRDDGLSFDAEAATVRIIREGDEYQGVRVTLRPSRKRHRNVSGVRVEGRGEVDRRVRSTATPHAGAVIRQNSAASRIVNDSRINAVFATSRSNPHVSSRSPRCNPIQFRAVSLSNSGTRRGLVPCPNPVSPSASSSAPPSAI